LWETLLASSWSWNGFSVHQHGEESSHGNIGVKIAQKSFRAFKIPLDIINEVIALYEVRYFKEAAAIIIAALTASPTVHGENQHTTQPNLSPTASPFIGSTLPSNALYQWTPGVSFRGGIPSRTGLVNVRNAPYNAKGDGSTDDTSAIQLAINALKPNQMAYIPAGIYRVTNTLFISVADTGITGDGPSKTIIKYSGESGGVDMIKVVPFQNYGNPVPITSACTQGLTAIALSSTSGVHVGDLLELSELNPSYVTDTGVNGNCSWCGAVTGSRDNTTRRNTMRLLTQLDKVASIWGNTVNLERPLYITFESSNSPQAQDVPTTYGIGVQSLQLVRNCPGVTGGNMIEFQYVSLSWISNVWTQVTSNSETNAHFYLSNTYGCEIRECEAKEAAGALNGSGQGYGVYLVGVNSDTLVEDNVFSGCQDGLVIAGGGSGCVFGYNYCIGSVNTSWPWWLSADMNTHGPEPYMNLFEGNIGDQVGFDNTWGGNAFNTAFRCWALAHGGEVPSGGHAIGHELAVDLEANTFSPNIVGCVLGVPGVTSSSGISYGSEVQASAFVNGNYSFATGETSWMSRAVALPGSLYYGSKPSWWTSLPFPPIGPDTTPFNGQIPAQVRFNFGL
jgi:hypothetical protein